MQLDQKHIFENMAHKATLSLPCMQEKVHWSKQLKDQPVLLLSSFVNNSSINEHKNMKLTENACCERIT